MLHVVVSHSSSLSSLQPVMAKRSADDAALLCRGGSSQKAKWVHAFASDEAPALVIGKMPSQPATPSKLSAFLIEKWGWGLISAPFLQQVASLSVEDGANHPDLKVLAKLGTSGKYPGKCHGELVAKLNPMSIDHALTNSTIWYRVGRKLKGCTHYALLPHELFALLYSQHRDAFTEHIMGGSADNLPKFWKAMGEVHGNQLFPHEASGAMPPPPHVPRRHQSTAQMQSTMLQHGPVKGKLRTG